MKAIPQLTRDQRRAIRRREHDLIQDALIKERELSTAKLMLLACLSLHEKFGFGAQRLVRFIGAFSKECEQQHEFFTDCGNDVLLAQARRIGLSALADDVEKRAKELEKLYGD